MNKEKIARNCDFFAKLGKICANFGKFGDFLRFLKVNKDKSKV